MRSPSSVKQEFLKKWLKGLQVYSGTKNEMSILERKKVIKLSADVAMASTRISTSSWSRALMANASNDAANKALVVHVLGADSAETVLKKKDAKKFIRCNGMNMMSSKRVRSKKILRKSCSTTIRRMRRAAAAAHVDVVEGSSIAKRLVMKRTEVLKRLVPGGEFMDEISLIRETLDYILSLRLQVDVMRHLANATQKLDPS